MSNENRLETVLEQVKRENDSIALKRSFVQIEEEATINRLQNRVRSLRRKLRRSDLQREIDDTNRALKNRQIRLKEFNNTTKQMEKDHCRIEGMLENNLV